jgi:hypothetical protein
MGHAKLDPYLSPEPASENAKVRSP